MFTRALTAIAVSALAGPAMAGFTVTTGTDLVLTPDSGLPGASIGDTFATASGTGAGTFAAYAPDTASDPQIAFADLNRYRYTFNGAVVSAVGPVITYAGNYSIFYDLDTPINGQGGADVLVSGGLFSIVATFVTGDLATLAGTLTQTQGPGNPAFTDLSYGGFPVTYTGTYTGTTPGVSGFIQGTLRQNAIIPAPGAACVLGAAMLGTARRRRR